MRSEAIITLPLRSYGLARPEWVRGDIAGAHRGRFEGFGPHRTLNPELTVDSARQGGVKDASHQVARELGLGITSLPSIQLAHLRTDFAPFWSLFMSVRYLPVQGSWQ